jgi:NAD(P)-dependent dehydrogenase (short-subunit alcohol dehydrogenase family)
MSIQTTSTSRFVLITGASTGIGEACALELDRRGFQVFAGVRREEDAQRLTQKASARLKPLLLDVTDADAIAAAAATVREAVQETGLFGLVNNAGIVVAGPLELLPSEQIRRQFEVNVIGQLAVTRALLPLIRLARGRIVNMGSISGRVSGPLTGPYAASKHALEALTESLRMELRPWGISVSIIEPGNVQTPIWEKSRASAERMFDQITSEGRELYGATIDAVRAASNRMAASGMPVDRVVRAVMHALTAKRPRPHYPVGLKTHLAILLFKFLPVRLRDLIVRREMGLD